MLPMALLAVIFSTTNGSPAHASAAIGGSPIRRCLATMDGAVFAGDPTDHSLMKADVAVCERGVAEVRRMHISVTHGPEKLFLTARLLERAATLAYIGLGDTSTALADVERANLYFRIATGLSDQSADFTAAATANLALTNVQLQTLHADIAATRTKSASTLALGAK